MCVCVFVGIYPMSDRVLPPSSIGEHKACIGLDHPYLYQVAPVIFVTAYCSNSLCFSKMLFADV